MAKIQINNPRQIINGGAKKYYFKVKGLGGPKGRQRATKAIREAEGLKASREMPQLYMSALLLPVGQDATVECRHTI